MNKGRYFTLVDSAHGSSGKAAASTRLVDILKIKNVSSCNYPNAGHSVVHNGEVYVYKCLPSPTILKKIKNRDDIVSWIGPNSGISLAQFNKEVSWTNSILNSDLFVHGRAVVVSQRHADAEGPGGSDSTLHIASTMSGSGSAFSEKVMRKSSVELVPFGINNWEFYKRVWNELENGHDFMHEVSQGFALSLNSGTQFPNCTFREATPQQAYADFGIKKEQIGDVYLNLRTFGIRVGNVSDDTGILLGNSGDFMPDSVETSWEQIGKDAEMPESEIKQLSERERTTVTRRIRRVSTFSFELLKFSAKFCGATKLIINFPQYLHYSAYKLRGGHEMLSKLHAKVRDFIDRCEDATGLKVCMIGTGAEHEEYIYLD